MVRGSPHSSHRTAVGGIGSAVPCSGIIQVSGKQHLCNLVYREVIIDSLIGLQSCTPCCHFGLCPLVITERYFQALVSQLPSLPWNARSSNCLPGSTVNWGLLLHLLCLQTLLINISTLLTPCHFNVGYIHEIVDSQNSRSGRFSYSNAATITP